MRTFIFWLHLLAGVVAGVVILIMSVTGVLLTYEKQMIAWADRTDAALPPVSAAPRLSADTLIAAARATDSGEAVVSLTVSSNPGAPALVTVGTRILALNPYTGAVLGESAPRLRPFFRAVTTWHRYLGAETGPIRQTMKAVTGWSNLLFLMIVVAGAYLWLPRKWTWTQLRAVLWFRQGLRGKARDFNWHNAIGIWCAVPLAIVIAGALPISFPWANRAVYQMVNEEPPAPGGGGGRAGGAGARAGGPGVRAGGPRAQSSGPANRGEPSGSEARDSRSIDGTAQPEAALAPLWQTAERQAPGWRTIAARLGGDGPVAFTIDRGYGGQPQLRETLTMDRATGQVVSVQRFEDQSVGRRLRSFLRFAHTGEYFGLPGQTIAGVASAGAVVLVWTGLALTLRRFRAWVARRSATTISSTSTRTAA